MTSALCPLRCGTFEAERRFARECWHCANAQLDGYLTGGQVAVFSASVRLRTLHQLGSFCLPLFLVVTKGGPTRIMTTVMFPTAAIVLECRRREKVYGHTSIFINLCEFVSEIDASDMAISPMIYTGIVAETVLVDILSLAPMPWMVSLVFLMTIYRHPVIKVQIRRSNMRTEISLNSRTPVEPGDRHVRCPRRMSLGRVRASLP